MSHPSHDDVRRVLAGLAEGTVSPGQAEDWADRCVMADDPGDEIGDAVWDALVRISGAAIEVAPGRRLYERADLESWLASFDATTPGGDGG